MKCTILVIAVLLLVPPESVIRDDYGNGKKGATSFLVSASVDEDEAAKKFRAVFISDIKRLLEHNRVFYNTYGAKDADVDLAFDEAKIAADVIYLYPQFFREKVQIINYRIEDALKKKEKMEMDDQAAVTADGVPVYFIDKGFLLIGALGGMGIIRFPQERW